LIPARNESDSIGYTIESIKKQTHSVDRIIVVANNCTDNTVEISLKYGAEVFEMAENRYMKAGALNYALEKIIPKLNDDDCILIMDADTILTDDLVAKCLLCINNNPYSSRIII
jgi:biofilm PGA synthesis N-glycosyltransferase PgaC